MTGILYLNSAGSKVRILLNDSIKSCREETDVNVVNFLKRAFPSSIDGRFPNCVKIASFISPLIEDLIVKYIAFAFWMALAFVRAVEAAVISASVTEW